MLKYRNIYQSARERAGMTQEAAAEQLLIAPETLRTYETSRRRPSDEMVMLMAELYSCPTLVYLHLKSGAFGDKFPELTERSLQEGALRLFRLLRDFARAGSVETLLEIAEDGVIDAAERPLFDAVMDALREIMMTALALSLLPEDQKKSPHRVAAR